MVGTKTACFGAYARASEDAVLSLLAKEGKTIVGVHMTFKGSNFS